jgi:hypothetical protein
MADALTDFLVNDHQHAKISPEMLELLGKQASGLFLEEGVALNESIPKLASAHPDVNAEQVKRICEFANNATYLALHDQDKTAGANASYPQFQLADPARILQDMSDGARPTVITPTDVAYGKQPLKTKVSHPLAEEALAELFKSASPDYELSRESAAEDVMAVKNQLKAMKENFANANETFDMSLKTASAEFYDVVKRHVLDGNSLSDVMVAVRSTGVDSEKIAGVMTPIIGKLIKEKVAAPQKLAFDMTQIEKIAHRVINPEHPLVTSFLGIVTSYHELEKTSAVLSEVDAELVKVNSFIQENFFAKRSA